jgi:hypothetical protein
MYIILNMNDACKNKEKHRCFEDPVPCRTHGDVMARAAQKGGDTPLDRHQRSEKIIAITPLVDGAPFHWSSF